MRLILVKVWITQHSLKSLLKYLISSKWCGSKIILHSPKKKLTTPRKLGQKHITFIWLRPFKSAAFACALSLQSGLQFIVEAIGNLDRDPSSTTAQGFLHGTGIHLFQFPKQASDGSQLAVQRVNLCSTRSASKDIFLHGMYSSVLPVSIKHQK